MKAKSFKELVSIARTIQLQFRFMKRDSVWNIIGLVTFVFAIYVPWKYSPVFWPTLRSIAKEPAMVGYLLLYILSTSLMFILYACYSLLYWLKSPYIEKYKDNEHPWPWDSDPEWKRKTAKALLLNFTNHVVLAGILGYIGTKTGVVRFKVELDEIPSFPAFIAQVIFMIFCEDFMFYWSHRTLHHEAIYPYIHKVHHEFYNSVVWTSEYAHPIEYIFGNVLPTLLGSTLLFGRAHVLAGIVFTSLRLLETCEAHCGYDFPFSLMKHLPFSCSPPYHNHHHATNIGNFGSQFIMWDSICGTNDYYYKQVQSAANDQCKTEDHLATKKED